ncbi:MAG TPA: hypothetical protein VD966_09715 [Pyrinomonadaceae bacterium]|nr:hypothetical protein [Pyrinomonadaceae bacterium]
MAKTIISAFDNQQLAGRVLDSLISSGFDSHLFSLIGSKDGGENSLDSVMRDVPSVQARLYQGYLRSGDSLLVAHVSDEDVAPLIRLLQSGGGHQIEAFDPVNVARQSAAGFR